MSCIPGKIGCFVVACLCCGTPGLAGAEEFRPGLEGKFLMEWGYDRPSDTHLLEELVRMEANAPFFDAVVVDARREGEPFPKASPSEWRKPHWLGNFSGTTWGREAFRWEPIASAARNFASLRPARFQEFFIRFNVTPGDVDWFDDAWAAVAHNGRVTARLIREGRLRGLMMDTEEYENPLFYYPQLPGRGAHALEEYRQQARKRGQELMTAINAESQELVILFSFAHSKEWPNDPKEREWIRKSKPEGPCTNSLLGPFIDGMLETATPGTAFYDGYERGYALNSAQEFIEARRLIEEAARFSFVPDIYRQRMKVAFGVWFDRDWRKRQGFYPDQIERNYYTPQDLACKVNLALQYSDRYAWVWSESVIWWWQRLRKTEKGIGPYIQAMAEARKPRPYDLEPADWRWEPQQPLPVPHVP